MANIIYITYQVSGSCNVRINVSQYLIFIRQSYLKKNKHFNRQLVNSFEENNVFTNVIHVYVWYLF